MRFLLALMHFAFFISNFAFAADGSKVSFGLLSGISFPSLSSGAFGYGFKAGYSVFPRLVTSIFYYKYGIGIQTSSGNSELTASTSNTCYAAEGMISFSDGFSAGVKLGLLSISPNVTAKNDVSTIQFETSDIYLHLGPTVSYDHAIGHFSIGGELSYLYTFSGSAPKVINVLAAAKVHF